MSTTETTFFFGGGEGGGACKKTQSHFLDTYRNPNATIWFCFWAGSWSMALFCLSCVLRSGRTYRGHKKGEKRLQPYEQKARPRDAYIKQQRSCCRARELSKPEGPTSKVTKDRKRGGAAVYQVSCIMVSNHAWNG